MRTRKEKKITIDLLESVAARYIVSGETVREVAKHFGLTKSTCGKWLHDYAKKFLSSYVYELIEKRAKSNILELKKYGKTLCYTEFDKDINLYDLDTYSNGDACIPMKPFLQDTEDTMTEEFENDINDFRKEAKEILLKKGFSEEFIKDSLTDKAIELALLNDITPKDFAMILSVFNK